MNQVWRRWVVAISVCFMFATIGLGLYALLGYPIPEKVLGWPMTHWTLSTVVLLILGGASATLLSMTESNEVSD